MLFNIWTEKIKKKVFRGKNALLFHTVLMEKQLYKRGLNMFKCHCIIIVYLFNCRRGLSWRSCKERRKGGRRNPGLQQQKKWSCFLPLLTLKLYQEFWEWWRLAKSSCFGVRKRWASSKSPEVSYREMGLQYYFLVDIMAISFLFQVWTDIFNYCYSTSQW